MFVTVAEQSKEQTGSGISDGDSTPWRELLSEIIPKLYRMFMERWPNISLAEELVQKTVFDAVRGRHGYDALKGSPQEWIFGIAYNNIRLELRKRAAGPAFDGDAIKYLEVIDTKLLPDEVLEQKETAQQVRAALDRLNENERAVLKARYLEDSSISDIARQMNITEKAVYNLLYRAGLSFRQQILRKTSTIGQGNNHGN
jgi:RNA polymerase sigma-70 factor (ECF subfamily)